jgi:hypothetical protein
MRGKRLDYVPPDLAEVVFAVLWEKGCERGFLDERLFCSGRWRLEWLDSPLIRSLMSSISLNI